MSEQAKIIIGLVVSFIAGILSTHIYYWLKYAETHGHAYWQLIFLNIQIVGPWLFILITAPFLVKLVFARKARHEKEIAEKIEEADDYMEARKEEARRLAIGLNNHFERKRQENAKEVKALREKVKRLEIALSNPGRAKRMKRNSM